MLSSDSQWYAVQTRYRHEAQVQTGLQSVGIEPLLPLVRHCRQRSDRKVWITLPLFPGYCFARFALTNSLAVLKTPGIVRIVGSLKPEPIDPDEIIAIQLAASTERIIEQCDYFTEGICVEVIQGALAGLRGQIVRREKRHALVIRATLIQQAALIHIKAEEVVPLSPGGEKLQLKNYRLSSYNN